MILQLKYRKVLRWLREDPISWSVLYIYIYIFIIYSLLGTRTRMQCELWHEQNLNPKQPPPLSLHEKNQIPRIHRKNPPRLAPKTIIPQTCKDTIHRDVQERDPNPAAGFPKTKETKMKTTAVALKIGDHQDEGKPLDLWVNICNHRRMVAPVITLMQGVGHQARR